MAILHIESAKQFEEEILSNEKTCLVDFYADWCVPCKMQAPIVEELAKEKEGIVFAKLNVDECPTVAGDYDIMSIPTIIVLKNGEVCSVNVGVQTKDSLEKILKEK